MISGVFSCLLFVFVVFPSVAFAQIRTGSRPASSYHHSTPNSPFVRGSPAQISAYLDAHNQVRAVNNAPPLTWSQPLADLAAIWADGCQFKSTGGLLRSQPYGENIVAATRYFPISAAVDTFTQDQATFYPSVPTYNHFTQVVWKSTTQLGCAVASCDSIFDPAEGKATLHVCLYDPAGNVIGEGVGNLTL